MDVAGAVRTELTSRVKLFGRGGQVVLPMGGTSWDSHEAREGKRLFAMTLTALVLGFWGLTMTLAGFAADSEPTPANPKGSAHGLFLIAGGGALMGTAAGLYLGVRRVRKRTPGTRSSPSSFRSDPQKSETAL
jgi:hypothetical protein